MITNNGHLLCAIDTETTGLSVDLHDIWEIAIIPLNYNLRQDKTRPVFECVMCPPSVHDPEAMEALDKSSFNQSWLQEHGIDSETGVELFLDWHKKLNLKEGGRIIPLAHNWKFDLRFIEKWLGIATTNYYFDARARDTFPVAMAINDACEMLGEPVMFPKQTLTYLCSILGVQLDKAHRALDDAYATADVYRKMLSIIKSGL